MALFDEALRIAELQSGWKASARAAAQKVVLLRSTGASVDPSDLILPILTRIDGGDQTRDVRRAKACL
jgi:hypothetical protein